MIAFEHDNRTIIANSRCTLLLFSRKLHTYVYAIYSFLGMHVAKQKYLDVLLEEKAITIDRFRERLVTHHHHDHTAYRRRTEQCSLALTLLSSTSFPRCRLPLFGSPYINVFKPHDQHAPKLSVPAAVRPSASAPATREADIPCFTE